MSDESPLHEIHPELFHYTSALGLKGILRSQSLWGTHWRFLNDVAELQHFSEKLPSLLKPVRMAEAERLARDNKDFKKLADSQGGMEIVVDADVQGLVEMFQESMVHPDPAQQIFEYYVTSFCTPEGSFEEVREHGLLSMWRSYANGGYALVFDTKALVALLWEEAKVWPAKIELAEVGYSCDPTDVLELRISALPVLRRIFNGFDFEGPQENFEQLLDPMTSCFINYKHWAFAEEREVRLTSILNGEKMRNVHAQEGTTWRERERHIHDAVPRIHLFEGLGRLLPIKRIIVGPGGYQQKWEAELMVLLNELELDIPVVLSNIPLR